MKITHNVLSPLSTSSLNHESKALHKEIETLKFAQKVISHVAKVLTGACIVGVWVLRLKLVVYSGAIKILMIPASLLALPMIWTTWWIASKIFDHKIDKGVQNYHEYYLKQFVKETSPSDQLKKKYAIVSENITTLDLTKIHPHKITEDKLTQIVEATPTINSVIADASLLPTNFLSIIIGRLSHLDKVKLSNCQNLTKDEFSVWEKTFAVESLNDHAFALQKRPPFNSSPPSSKDVDYDYDVDYNLGDSSDSLSFAFEWD